MRLDVLLAARGLAPSRERAQALILAGCVLVEGRPAKHSGDRVADDAVLEVRGSDHAFVSRGGVKLAAALDGFALDVGGRCCVDVGASTGGFTDCLLQRGAAVVHAIDVGYGQLAWKLRTDPRVRLHERTNVRSLAPGSLAPVPDLAVIDASFISLRLVLPPTLGLLAIGGRVDVVALVKPQFEVGREGVERGGVVRRPELRAGAVASVQDHARQLGLEPLATLDSPITGAKKGNQEILVHLRRPG